MKVNTIPTLPPTTALPRFITFEDCGKGQTAAKTGCTPQEGGGGKESKSTWDKGVAGPDEESGLWGPQLEQSEQEIDPEFTKKVTIQEKFAANNYTRGGYKKLNSALMRGGELEPDQEELRENPNSIIEKHGKFDKPQILYRGIRVSDFFGTELENAVKEFEGKVGQTIKMKGFQSTSNDTAPALDASSRKSGHGLIFSIESEKGAPLSGMSDYDDESEVLLGSDWEYEVVGVERDQKVATDIWADDSIDRHIVKLRVK